MDTTNTRFFIGLFVVLFALFGIGYFCDISFITRGAATTLTGSGIGILGGASAMAWRER